MTEDQEQAYIQGTRWAWLMVLKNALKELGYIEPAETTKTASKVATAMNWTTPSGSIDAARLIAEREEAINTLRNVCRDHGDNDWPEDLYLADIIEKHLARHLDDE